MILGQQKVDIGWVGRWRGGGGEPSDFIRTCLQHNQLIFKSLCAFCISSTARGFLQKKQMNGPGKKNVDSKMRRGQNRNDRN